MQPPEKFIEALRQGIDITLTTTSTGSPTVGARDTASTLWILEGFTDQAAHYFVDNFVEPYGYAPANGLTGVWIRTSTSKKQPLETGEP